MSKQQNPPEGNLRRVLHSAYSFVRSVEMNKASAAFTLDHAIKEQMKTIGTDPEGSKGKSEAREAIIDTGGKVVRRPSRWELLDKLEKDIEAVAKQIEDAGDDPAKLAAIGILPTSKKKGK